MTTLDDFDTQGWMPSPAVIAAEASLIGSVIQSRVAAELASETVTSADFFKPAHQLVFEAVVGLIDDGNDVDPVAVLGELTRRGTADKMGGGPALATLMSHAGTGELRYCAKVVHTDAIRRNVNSLAGFITEVTSGNDFDLDRDIDRIRERLDAATARVTGDQLPTIGEIVLRRLDEIEAKRPLEFVEAPYIDVHAMLAGLRPGQVVVVGARPSVGKTIVGLDFARNAAIRLKQRTLLFSLEMSNGEIADRVLAAEAKVSLAGIRDNQLSETDWDSIVRSNGRIQEAPLVVDDSPHCTLGRIRARLRGLARTDPARLVVVDYLGLMDAPKGDSRERQVAELSRGLKLLAKEFRVPIIALSQLNRESTKRPDRRPTMSELRDSGAVEQDADIVILLHREDAFEKESPRAGEMDVIVDKNRNGPTGTITVAFQGHYARAVDMAAEWSPTRSLQ